MDTINRNLAGGDTVDGQNPAPPHHFTLEGSHSNPRAPSFNVGATPLRRWCRILDLQLVFVSSLWWPQCCPLIQCWRDPSEEVVQDFGPSTCFCFLTVVAQCCPLIQWRDPSEEVVQDFGPSTCFCFLTVARPL